jgi:GH24 family phage-related lysozyme (muramidase)
MKAGKVAMSDAEIDAAFDVLVGEAEKIVSSKIKEPIPRPARIAFVSMAYQNPSLVGRS